MVSATGVGNRFGYSRHAVQLRLGNEIGSGAIGRVVELLDEDDSVVFAGKILHDSHRGDSAARIRFANEAALLKDLTHPNLVGVFGIQEIEGSDVLLMERIVGDSLDSIIARSAPLPESTLLELAVGISAGLAAAHHAGMIHRDLKPANVLVTEAGIAKIVDFGMARATSFAGIGDDTLAVVGTPAYMAPETIDPLAVDARSDLYALGCILYEMATGVRPYSGATSFAVLENHRSAPIPALPAETSPALSALIEQLLAKSPADRVQSAATTSERLESIANSEQTALAKTDWAAEGRCAACGEALVSGVNVCFGCGDEQPSLSDGNRSVFVVGPGEIAGKLDIGLRQALLDWLRANPNLGLDPTPLSKKVPRLPFPIAIGVSEPAADTLSRALRRLGLDTETTKGGRFSLRGVRRKAWKLSARIALIGITSSVYWFNYSFWGFWLGATALGSVVGGWGMAARLPTKRGKAVAALPPAIEESLDRVAGILPAMTASRHRQNLRAVVQRVLSLRDFFEQRKVTDVDTELSRVIDLAVVASSRIDELEQSLTQTSIRSADDDLRDIIRERDMWAARLMETTASLESLRARYLAGAMRLEERERDSVISELRIHIEALREVENL